MHRNQPRRGLGNRGASNQGFGQDRHGLLGDSPGLRGRKKGHGGPGLLGSAPTPEMLGIGGGMHGMGDTGGYDDDYNQLSYGGGGGSGGMGRGMGRGNRQGLRDSGQFENRQMGRQGLLDGGSVGRPGLLDNLGGGRGGLLDERNPGGSRAGLLDDRNLGGGRGGLMDDRNLGGGRGGLLDDRNMGGARGGLLDDRNIGGNRGSLLDDRNIGGNRGGHFEDRNVDVRSSLLDDRPARGGLLDDMPRGRLLDDRGMPGRAGGRHSLLERDNYDSGGLLDREPLINRRTLLSENQEVQHILNVQQQQIAALKDSQLQMVSNLLQQQGGAGLLPHQQQNMKSSLLGTPAGNVGPGGGGMGRGSLLGSGGGRGSLLGPGGARMGRGGIPSIFDIKTNAKGGGMQLGKRGIREQRDGGMGAGPHKRMRRDMRGGHQSPRGLQRNQDRHFRRDNDKRDDRSRDRPSTGGRHSDRSPSTHSSRDRNRSGGRKDEKKDIKKETEKKEDKEETKNGEEEEITKSNEDETQNENQDVENKDEEMADAEDVDEKKDDMDTSDTSLTVTIDKSGRSVNDPQRKKSDSESDGKKTNFYCHACAVDCRNETSFTNHMKGNRHRDRMNMLLNLHQKKSYELADRMKAEEHLRKIEGKPRPDYCRTCDIKFDGTFQQHRQTREHKKKVEKEKLHGKEHSDEEDEEFPDNFVTVDTIGYDDDDVNMDADGGKKLGKFKVDIDFVIPDYDPQKPLGQNFIVPVTGYFCKLCHKFYNNEQAAKVTHCQSEPHYDKFQKMMLAKKLSQKMEKEKQSADIKEEQKVDIQEEQKDSTERANEKNNTESNQSATTETSQSKTTNGSIDQSENGETEIKVEETGEAEEKAEEDVTMDTNVDTSVAEEEHEEEEDVSPKSKAKGSTRGRGKQRARRGKKV